MTGSLLCIWLRRYKWFFGIGLLILFVQLFLANWLPSFGSAEQSHFAVSPHDSEASSSLSRAGPTAPTNAPKKLTKRYQLRKGDLEAYPGCDISSNDALSAIQRATTQACKQTIANITCAIQGDTFYAKSLPNSCPNESFIASRSLGCFQDQREKRLLDGYSTVFKHVNTPSKCIQLCLQSGFLYAGVQYTSECFCGNTEPPATAKLNDTACKYVCLGEPMQTCGGYFMMNVYETGISKFVAQSAQLHHDGQQEEVKIVFLLTLNGRALRQVHRLLKSLYSPKHFYYIHVDSRQDYLYRELLKLETHAANIRLARNRYSTIWGGASLLTMLLASMEDLLTLSWRWDFVINLSESDFPVKTLDKLVDFLSANRDRNFVKSHGREVQHFILKQGLDKTFVECDTHMWRIGDRKLPAGIQIDGGSDWVALSRPFVQYVVHGKTENELISGLLKVFQHTLLPAESFFHTAIRNSQFCNTYVDNNLHLTNWKRRLGCNCQTKHVVDWCGCSPNDYKPDDWPRILLTEGKQLFFARKFEAIINQAVILKLETWLYGQSHMLDVPNARSYWQSVYDHNDVSPKPDRALLLVAERILHAKLSAELTDFEIVKILDIHIYKDNDIHRGILIHANVTVPGSGVVGIELWSRPDQQPQASRSLALGKRISHLEVSSDFDMKEKVSRNFVQVLTPKSEPTVVMHIRESTLKEVTTYNVTILWISPAGLLVDVTEVHMEDSVNGDSIHFSKSNMKPPLLAGVWTVKVLHQKKIISKCEFMILPLEDGNEDHLNEENLRAQALGSSTNWSHHLGSAPDTAKSIKQALTDAALVGNDRITWIDRMVKRFYVYKDICATASASGFASVCSHTNWSSMAVDPKSDIYADLTAS